jgi:small subunit ribosomal protein S13
MVYVLNTNLNGKKKIHIALQEIYGLGKYQSNLICAELGISSEKRLNQLKPKELEAITSFITQNYEIGMDVKRLVLANIQRFIKIGAYRGFRHIEGLPVRGQKTHGNSRTTRRLKKIFHIHKKS